MWGKEFSYPGKSPLSLWAIVLIEGRGDITVSSFESLGTSYVSQEFANDFLFGHDVFEASVVLGLCRGNGVRFGKLGSRRENE